MAGFSDVIEITEKIDWNVKSLFELGNVNWIDGIFDVVKAILFKIL